MRGFIPYSSEDGRVQPWQYFPSTAIKPVVGMALMLSSGKLAIATGTTRPTYISMYEAKSTLAPGDIIPVIPVERDQIFETTCSASLSGAAVGAKVTLHASNGCQVTGTTTSGVAEIVDKDGDASGSRVLVKFS